MLTAMLIAKWFYTKLNFVYEAQPWIYRAKKLRAHYSDAIGPGL
jgi:hypothetical protein